MAVQHPLNAAADGGAAAATAAATAVHAHVSALLHAPLPSTTDEQQQLPPQLAASLAQLVSINTRLQHDLAARASAAQLQLQAQQQVAADGDPSSAAPPAAPAPIDEDLAAATAKRSELLAQLLATLDSAVLGLRAQLDAAHTLLAAPPCAADPDLILRTAHTLRHGFAPLGAAPGQLQVPPAPQLPFMLHSTLRLYNIDLAAQQAQAAAAAAQAAAPPAADAAAAVVAVSDDAAAVAVPPTGGEQQQQQQPPDAAAGAAAAGKQQQQQQPAVQFLLNQDLLDDELLVGEEVTEDYSEEYSDSD